MDNTLQSSLEWVEQSRQGNRDAFAKIVGQYQGMVSAVTLNVVGDYAQSEDLAQETFLTAWKNLSELREPEKIAAWIYGIARRTALNWIEKQQRNPLRGAAELDGNTAIDPRLELEQARRKNEQLLELVWSTVKELPETFREPLLLYYRYSKSATEIAASMDLTEDAVNQRLSRGRKMLKTEVEKQIENVLEATRPDIAFTLAVRINGVTGQQFQTGIHREQFAEVTFQTAGLVGFVAANGHDAKCNLNVCAKTLSIRMGSPFSSVICFATLPSTAATSCSSARMALRNSAKAVWSLSSEIFRSTRAKVMRFSVFGTRIGNIFENLGEDFEGILLRL